MLIALLMVPLPAQAHGALHEQLTIRMTRDTARVSLVAPAGAFRHADTDADGLLSTAEVQASREALLETLDAGLILSGAERTFGDVLVPGHGEAADHLQLILQYRWDGEPTDVMLDYSLFSAEASPMPIRITDTHSDVRRQGELTPALSRAQVRGEAPAAGLRHPPPPRPLRLPRLRRIAAPRAAPGRAYTFSSNSTFPDAFPLIFTQAVCTPG